MSNDPPHSAKRHNAERTASGAPLNSSAVIITASKLEYPTQFALHSGVGDLKARYATSFSPLASLNPPTTAASFINPLFSTSALTNRKNLFTRRLTHALVREMSTPAI